MEKFDSQDLVNRSIFTVKQDIKLLEQYAVPYWAKHIKSCLEMHSVSPDSISYVIPHVSSMFFYDKIINELKMWGWELMKVSGLPICLKWETLHLRLFLRHWMSFGEHMNLNPVKNFAVST